jgi:hypothetical protein
VSFGKTYIGIEEIQYLNDHDMKSDLRDIEDFEQHRLVWCLIRVTALRPSSRVYYPDYTPEDAGPQGYDDLMKWRDFTITRASTSATCDVYIKVRKLKAQSRDAKATLGSEIAK